ncbi:MAG TPA: hypothetical protein VKM94_23895 [Blastocatellia bacterium]|nr:hypothetical protein [Blastocatellia bacterium]
MFRLRLTTTLAVVLFAASAIGANGQERKRYEMYSWKVKGTWHYSLVEGVGRVKKYSDVIHSPILARGTSGLEEVLTKLQRGDEIIWMSDVPSGVQKPGSVSALSFKQPSGKRVKRWIDRCSRLGIRLTLR